MTPRRSSLVHVDFRRVAALAKVDGDAAAAALIDVYSAGAAEVAEAKAAAEAEQQAARAVQRRRYVRAQRLAAAAETSVPMTPAMRERVEAGDVEETQAVEDVRFWLATPLAKGARPVVILCGTPGVGKTIAAADAIASTEGARYVKAKRLVGLAASQYGDERRLFVEACTAPLLVIDEIGLEKTEAGAREALLEVIDERLGLRTLIIGNLEEPAVRQRLDPRTLSRLDEVGSFLDVKGEDLRARGRR